MYIGEYLKNKRLVELERLAQSDKNNFDKYLKEAAKVQFGRELEPVVYSNIKKLNKGKIFGNRELCAKGLHLFRYAFSTYATQHNTRKKEYLENGKVVVENFLPEEIHHLIQNECNHFPLSVNKQADNNCYTNSKNNPGIDYCLNHSGMRELILDCIGTDTVETNKLYKENTFVQRVDNKPDDGDIQKDLHSDIFFPAVKWWYFPDEVELGKGPFRFQKTAPKYDYNFWNWLYKQTVDISMGRWDRTKTYGHIEGSFRVTKEELNELDIKVEPVTVKANTLVIANVQLFHGRGDTTTPHIRNSVHGSIRVRQPFIVY